MLLAFTPQGWEDYTFWQRHDKTMLKRLNRLISDSLWQPFEGLGKPEALRHDLAGCWSRRIDGEHRLVYRVQEEMLVILQCRYHYH